MKKIKLIFSLALLFFILTPVFAFAQCLEGTVAVECDDFPLCCCPTGLVPCGGPTCPCTLCHFFVMIQRIVTFALNRIVPVIAALMIIIAAAMMVSAYAGQSGPEMVSRAKRLLSSVIIGLFIVYLAWIIINLFLTSINVAEWTGLENWWVIDCETPVGPPDDGEWPPIGEGFCGDGVAQAPNADLEFEECDGADLRGLDCTDFLFSSPHGLACDENCNYDIGGCFDEPPIEIPGCMDDTAVNYDPAATVDDGSCDYCGNGIIEDGPPAEACDCGPDGFCSIWDLDGNTCEGFGYTGGNLGCSATCFAFDFSECIAEEPTFCGDGIRQWPNDDGIFEECEKPFIESCADFGFTGMGGALDCDDECQWDTSGCVKTFCGDGLIQNPNDDGVAEVCDCGTDGVCTLAELDSNSCEDFGLAPGVLACLPDCLGFDPSGCGPVLPPEAGDRLWNCQYNGAAMSKLAAFDGSSVYLLGYWSINRVDSGDGFNWFTTCQPDWFGDDSTDGWKDLNVFASTPHPDGNYIAYAGSDGSYLFFSVEDGELVLNQDLCGACPDNNLGLCDLDICLSLGSSCRNVLVSLLGGGFGNMCVVEDQCDSCGMVIGDICNAVECAAIGPACSYDPTLGICH